MVRVAPAMCERTGGDGPSSGEGVKGEPVVMRSLVPCLRGGWLLPVVLAALAIPLGELTSDGGAGLEFKNGGSYDDQPTCAQA